MDQLEFRTADLDILKQIIRSFASRVADAGGRE